MSQLSELLAKAKGPVVWFHGTTSWGEDVLVPVQGTYGDTDSVLVMDYAKPAVIEGGKPISKRAAQEIRRARHLLGLPIHDADFDFNWGRHDGQMKLLDYGSGAG